VSAGGARRPRASEILARPGTRQLLFVYGTLLRGEANHALLRGSRFVGETATAAGFELLALGDYPAMVKSLRGTVQGELFEVTDPELAAIDRLEEHPRTFWRTAIRLVDRRRAQAYLMPIERLTRGARPIPSGDWRRR
jgi:gamma-glutamylcyclotransferase (GGCT)/AIG2-like uncharacterized protein YtfP